MKLYVKIWITLGAVGFVTFVSGLIFKSNGVTYWGALGMIGALSGYFKDKDSGADDEDDDSSQ